MNGAGSSQLAPQVVVRAALWSQQALLALADEAVARASAAAGEDDPTYVSGYATAISTARRRLWATTMEDARFRTALAVTNPTLLARFTRKGWSAVANKAARHTDTTLYRHLARAVGRTEPCDLWSGVALASWGPRTELVPVAQTLAFAPDLVPFRALFSALASEARYQRRGLFKLNPTLVRRESSWIFQRREGGAGGVSLQELPSSAWVDRALQAGRALSPLSFPTLCAQLALTAEQLEALVQAGIVVGGLAFPVSFQTAWEALLGAACQLDEVDARGFRATVRALRRLCRRLEGKSDALGAEEVLAAHGEVARQIAALATCLGVPVPPLSRAPLRCDAGLPWRIVLGPAWQSEIARALAEHETFRSRFGLTAAADEVHFAQVLAGTSHAGPSSADGPVTWETLLGGLAPAEEGQSRLACAVAAWRLWRASGEWPATVAALAVTSEEKLPPFGCFVAHLGRARLDVVGVSAEVAHVYGRYAPLFERRVTSAPPRHALQRWFAEVLADLAKAHGLTFAELVFRADDLPNAAARPSLPALTVLDVWGTTPGQLPLADLSLERHEDGAVFLRTPSHVGPLAVVSLSPVDAGARDPLAERLLLTSFRILPRWASERAVSFTDEIGAAKATPAARLPGGSAVRARRLVLAHEAALALTSASPARRFHRWQALGRAHALPSIVRVQLGRGAPLLLPRDCPLALEALFEGSKQGLETITIEMPDEGSEADGLLVDHEGGRHVTEIAVPFRREHHAWSHLEASSSPFRRMDSDERRAS